MSLWSKLVNPAFNKGKVTLLHSAAYYGQVTRVKLLLALRANIEVRHIGGATPLHCAARGAVSTVENLGHLEVVELLIAKGADINAKDVHGWTPLYVANYFERSRTAELLRKHGGHE